MIYLNLYRLKWSCGLSVKEPAGVTPAAVLVVLLLFGGGGALVLRRFDPPHVGHIRSRLGDVLLLLLHLHLLLLERLRVLLVLKLPARLLLTVQNHQLLSELLVLQTQLLAHLDQPAEAVDVVRVLIVDVLVDLQRLIQQVHASVTRSDHEGPLVLFGLDLLRPLKVNDGLLKHVILGVVHAEAGDHVDLGGVVAVALLIEVDSLKLVLLLLVEVAHFREDLRVTGHLRDQNVVPFEGLATHTNQLVHVGDLVNHLIAVRNNGVELLKCLERFVVVAETLVNQSQIVDGLNAVSLDTNGFEEELFGAVVIVIDE